MIDILWEKRETKKFIASRNSSFFLCKLWQKFGLTISIWIISMTTHAVASPHVRRTISIGWHSSEISLNNVGENEWTIFFFHFISFFHSTVLHSNVFYNSINSANCCEICLRFSAVNLPCVNIFIENKSLLISSVIESSI